MPDEPKQPEQPPPQPPPAPPPMPPPSGPKVETVTISAADYQDLVAGRSRLTTLEEQQKAIQAESQAKELRAQIEKGELTKVLESLRQQGEAQIAAERAKAEAIEQRAMQFAIDGELARALSQHPIDGPDAILQLTRLIRSELAATAQGNSYAVHTIQGYQPVADYVATLLAQPGYARYLRAATTGGTGGQRTQATPTGAGAVQPPLPKNLGEDAIQRVLAAKKAAGDPNTNTDLPMFGTRRSG